MRIINIDLSSESAPSYGFGGYAGEHRETQLVITLPERIGYNSIYTIWKVVYLTSRAERIDDGQSYIVNSSNVLTCNIPQPAMVYRNLEVQVEAYEMDGETIVSVGKSCVFGLAIDKSLSGTAFVIDDVLLTAVMPLPTDHTHDDRYYTETEIDVALALKQGTLTFDDVPTVGSNNPVKSGGVAAELAKKNPYILGVGAPTSATKMADGTTPITGTLYYDTTAEYLVPYMAHIIGEGVATQLKWNALQVTTNRVTSITGSSSDLQYPTAKAVWTLCDDNVIPVASNTILGGIKVGENLKIDENGVLSVDTATDVEQDNTKPVTSAAVHVQLGNVEALLSTL